MLVVGSASSDSASGFNRSTFALVQPIFRAGFPTSVDCVLTGPYRHTQRFVSMLILNPIKLTISATADFSVDVKSRGERHGRVVVQALVYGLSRDDLAGDLSWQVLDVGYLG